jgi:allophanate hydrolase subunit 2
MGYRLDGPHLARRRRDEMISGPTTVGALQVPLSGEPILLMADRQTTGGYPVIATVITADIGRVGQLAPGDELSLTVCTWQEAMAALIAQERALTRIEAHA